MFKRFYFEHHRDFNSNAIHIFLVTAIAWMLVYIAGCDASSDRDNGKKSGGAVYVSPSMDYRGRYRRGHVRKSVSTSPDALKSQARSRYYYHTRGKYRKKK